MIFHKRRLLRQADLALFHFLICFDAHKFAWQVQRYIRRANRTLDFYDKLDRQLGLK